MDTSLQLRILKTWASTVLIVGVAALLWPSSLLGHVDYVMVSGTSMQPGMHTGDLVLVRKTSSYEVGDAIAYRVPDDQPGAGAVVIHRITGGDGDGGYITQGDNRDRVDVWRPTDDDVLGRRWALVPVAGHWLQSLQNPAALAGLAAAVAFAVSVAPRPRQRVPVSP